MNINVVLCYFSSRNKVTIIIIFKLVIGVIPMINKKLSKIPLISVVRLVGGSKARIGPGNCSNGTIA
jgi:hypothetical protein